VFELARVSYASRPIGYPAGPKLAAAARSTRKATASEHIMQLSLKGLEAETRWRVTPVCNPESDPGRLGKRGVVVLRPRNVRRGHQLEGVLFGGANLYCAQSA
jgi:hypothetical protein